MHHAGNAPGDHRATGRPQRFGVRLSLVAQRVERRGDDDGRRQSGQIGGPQRRVSFVVGIVPGRVVAVEERDVVAGQQQPLRRTPRGTATGCGGRSADRSAVGRPGSGAPRRGASRQATVERLAPALSPPTATQPGSAPKLAGVCQRPLRHGVRVLDSGRERVLRSQPVVHREHVGARRAGTAAGTARRGCPGRRRRSRRRGRRPAAAASRATSGRRVVAGGQRTARAGHGQVGTLPTGVGTPATRAACSRIRRRVAPAYAAARPDQPAPALQRQDRAAASGRARRPRTGVGDAAGQPQRPRPRAGRPGTEDAPLKPGQQSGGLGHVASTSLTGTWVS